MKTMDDDVVAGRSQWKPVTVLRLICQVDGVKRLSEKVAKGSEAGQRWNVLEDWLQRINGLMRGIKY